MKKRSKIELHEATLLTDSEMKKVVGGNSDPNSGACRSANGMDAACLGSCNYSQLDDDGINYTTFEATCVFRAAIELYQPLYTCYCAW